MHAMTTRMYDRKHAKSTPRQSSTSASRKSLTSSSSKCLVNKSQNQSPVKTHEVVS